MLIASKAAKRIAAAFKGRFAHDAEADIWHVFDGACWRAEATPKTLHREFARWLDEATEPVGYTPRYMDSALTMIQRRKDLPLPEPHVLMPFKNGLLDATTRQLVKTTPANALDLGAALQLYTGRYVSGH